MHPMNFSRGCEWKHHQHSAAEWRKMRQHGMHPIFRTFSFLSCCNLEADELHVVWLGVAQYLLGSALWLLCFRMLPSSPARNLLHVWARIQDRGGCIFQSMQLNLFINIKRPMDEYPKLKGRGAQIKSLVAPLLHVWASLGLADVFSRPVSSILETLLQRTDLVDASSAAVFMPLGDCVILEAAVDRFLGLYTELGLTADAQGLLLFTAAPKLHWMWHWASRCRYLHPRRPACWLDEDFMKHCKILAGFATRGAPRHKVPCYFVPRYRQALSLSNEVVQNDA
eukprot:9481536-Pyramimonas_sp.AAC.1